MDDSLQLLLEKAQRAAKYGGTTILISGETGSGKTWLARRIHAFSPRSAEKLVEIDCTSIARNLAESELFGHVKGAFTGAVHDRPGRIRSAEGGTLFLDEVGELEYPLQAKLLKVLEDRCVTPVGSERSHPVDVRIIAATNRDLRSMVERGEFRHDLLERLSQVCLGVPPLRSRPGHAVRLALDALAEWNGQYGEHKAFSPQALETIGAYGWPGNVRELKNAVVSSCVLAPDDMIGSESLPLRILPGPCGAREDPGDFVFPESGIALKEHLEGIERRYFEGALSRCGGNAAKAAVLLGMKAPAFRKALKERHASLWPEPKHEAKTESGESKLDFEKAERLGYTV
jgi:transcriptional regulator with GAF, ATPase, and Fis domain